MHIKRGFTIIELLIVIVIIGLLTSVATISFISAQRNARDNTRKTQVQSIATAVETYYATKRSFPGKETLPSDTSPDTTGCQTVDPLLSNGLKSVLYFYKPEQNCPAAEGFVPAGSWIPNLGEYLSPFPAGDNYQPPLHFIDPLNPGATTTLDQIPNTLIYRHLKNGYAVYAKLEHSNANDEGILPGDEDFNKAPLMPSGTTPPPADWNIYMIRK